MTPKAQNLINIALVVLIFPVCALVVKDLFSYLYAVKGVEVKRPEVTARARPAEIRDFAAIVESPVFPSPAEKFTPLSGVDTGTGVASRPSADPSKVLSGLRLTGTYVGEKSFAVFVKAAGNIEGAFTLGEEVFGQGLLKRVTKQSAVIVSNGAEVELKMPEENLPRPQPLTLRPLTRPGRAAAPPAAQRPPGAVSLSRQTGENEWVISQSAVLNALEDMGAVLSAARMTPVREGSTVTGFLVTEIRPRGIMDAIGLKNGDILKRVNGYEITSPERAVQVLSALKGETSFDLDIVRRGESLSFHYDVR